MGLDAARCILAKFAAVYSSRLVMANPRPIAIKLKPWGVRLPRCHGRAELDHPLVASLNPPQREAVLHTEGPLLILAGPGSGKTRVVTHRIAHLLAQGVPDYQILALTFTNKAADEMRRRVSELVPGAKVWMSTFHRFCARLLRQYATSVGLGENFTIYDTDDSRKVLKQTVEELGEDLTHVTPERLQAAISWAKNHLIPPDRYEPQAGSAIGKIVARVYPAYQARLLADSAVDFDDLLLHVVTLLTESPELRRSLDARYRYIMVDEYQDTNLAQYTIVRALSIDHPNLAVTGDPDQSIYGWRGANLNNILEFEKDFPKVQVVRLEQNYRSTQRILRVADQLITHNRRRKPKSLFTDNAEGSQVRLVKYLNNRVEAESIAARIASEVQAGRRRPRDYAIFYRTNALSRNLESALREYAIPYQMVNGLEFYQRKEIKDVLAYLHLLNNPRDRVALTRIINVPARGIGKSSIVRLAQYATQRGKSMLDAAREAGLIEGLTKRAAVAVARFVATIDHLSLVRSASVEMVIRAVLEETGYRAMLKESDDTDDQERLANVEELLTAAREFDEHNPGPDQLENFLEQACLVNDTDAWEVDDDRTTLMTIHAAKGLEFPVVFIIAVEEGLLPHERSREDAAALEEERRLLFVAITRAREELQLSLVRQRDFRGSSRYVVPSQFLMELQHEELEMTERLFPEQVRPQLSPEGMERLAAMQGIADLDAVELDILNGLAPGEAMAAMQDMVAPATASGLAANREPNPTFREGPPPRLTTAAALAERETASGDRPAIAARPATPPDDFLQGMLVQHPEYGLGKILEASGTGQKRTVTVAFVSGAGQKKFLVVHSPLILARA
jgi:DNA helicase II / ATP-dependent DNA helicase PcrA